MLNPEIPGEPVDAEYLGYSPDTVVLGTDNVLYILSSANLSVFRWSVTERRYLESIPLVEAPKFMTYSPVTHRLYLAYDSGKITEIRLSESTSEQVFANSPQSPLGLSTANEYVFVCDATGAWESHFTYDPDGTLVSQQEWNYYSDEYIWSEANQKIYFFRDHTSPNDLIWEDIDADGIIGTQQDSPYHDSTGIIHPIRVAPDGSVVVLGSGRIYDAITLAQIDTLSNNISDATWADDTLYTLRTFDSNTQIQRWSSNYGVNAVFNLPGTPTRILTVGSELLVITNFYGLPRFSLFDLDLNEIFSSSTMAELTASNDSPSWLGQSTHFDAALLHGFGPITYNWDFDDDQIGSGQVTNHVYADLGLYSAVVTATNPVDILTATTTVTITDVPIADLSAANDSPTEVNHPTHLTASIAAGTNVAYSWDFGDNSSPGSGASITHTYTELGEYTAVVTAGNSMGMEVATTTVTIVEEFTPILAVSPNELVFNAIKNGSNPPSQSFSITNAGTGPLSWTADDNKPWLNIGYKSGTAPATVDVSVNIAGLAPGTYSGKIMITSPNVQGSPQNIDVTLVVASPPSPSPIELVANAGLDTIKLEWSPAADPLVTTYRIFRKKNGQSFSQIASTSFTSYLDGNPNLIAGQEYCYKIEALRFDNSVSAVSNVACATFGQVTLWLPNTWAAPGQLVAIPVNIRNATGLRIAASDIWLDFDGSVLEPVTVWNTPLTAGYSWGYSFTEFPGYSRIRISSLSSNPPTLWGDGSLFWIVFEVAGSQGDETLLNLREFISGVGGSAIYTPEDVFTPIPLQLEDGLFRVGSGYILGDLNGNGVVESIDAYIALQIASGKLMPTWQQIYAGDINGNGQIDAGDASMIFYYVVFGEWPLNLGISSSDLQASGTTPIQLVLEDITGNPGTTVVTTLSAENLSDWAGGEFVIAYDPTLIDSVVDVKAIDLAQNFALQFHDDGQGLVHIALADSSSVSGSGAILEISVRIVNNAQNGQVAALTLAEAKLNDASGRDFATSALQKTIEIESAQLQIGQPASTSVYLPIMIK
ncbi:MAG: PKD domain-containing protein [Anaerolineae bacterium]|nr:PKD domain-containing protein [Anaerolineae bacterium]